MGQDDFDTPAVSKSTAQRLAESASVLAQQLNHSRQALRLQSAELSARAAIIESDGSRQSLSDAIDVTLKDAALACKCNAAALYLLDDDTQFLSTRGVHNLPENRLADEARELRGSRGDLEAMVQGVVVINDLHECAIDTWNCPEEAASAICVSVLNAGVPIGTMWLLASEVSEFGDAEAAAARLAAELIAMQLQSAAGAPASARSTPAVKTKAAVGQVDVGQSVGQWQMGGLPTGTYLAPGWKVDGMIESNNPWAVGWHCWDVLPDGTMMMAIAEADDQTSAGAMTAAVARAALAAHTGYRHTPQQIMQRISDTLWQTNSFDQLTSLMYAKIDPETGEGELAVAGSISAMIASRYGYRPVVEASFEPLASRIDVNLGVSSFRLMTGEVLMAHTGGLVNEEVDQMRIGNRLKESMRSGDTCPLASVRRAVASSPLHQERGAVTMLRQ